MPQLFLGSENFYMRDCLCGGDNDSKTLEDILRGVLQPPLLTMIWMEFGMGNMDGVVDDMVGWGIWMKSGGCGWRDRYGLGQVFGI